jgi:hypothetical protein
VEELLLNVYGVGGVRRTYMHTAETFLPETSASEIEAVIRNLKSYKSPGAGQIPAELIQGEGGRNCTVKYINVLS